MLRIAIQAKGRLNEETMALLTDAGIRVVAGKRKLMTQAIGFRRRLYGSGRCGYCRT